MASSGLHSESGSTSTPPGALRIDDSKAEARYANFCRVIGTPEELVIDFGLNTQSVPSDDVPVAVSQRLVINYFTAKRLLQALTASVTRYESTFGPLETNVNKRAEKK